MTNKAFAQSDQIFYKACELTGVKPTPRQASKFRLAAKHKVFKGRASKFRAQAIEEVNKS